MPGVFEIMRDPQLLQIGLPRLIQYYLVFIHSCCGGLTSPNWITLNLGWTWCYHMLPNVDPFLLLHFGNSAPMKQVESTGWVPRGGKAAEASTWGSLSLTTVWQLHGRDMLQIWYEILHEIQICHVTYIQYNSVASWMAAKLFSCFLLTHSLLTQLGCCQGLQPGHVFLFFSALEP